jgi:hypothetical protein
MANKTDKRERMDMRVPGDLKRWVTLYARKKRKSVTQVFVDHLLDLQMQEERNGSN